MSRKSSIKGHINRLDMERQYLAGNSIASIARDYEVSEDALRNHCQNHLSRQLVQAYAKKELAGSMDLLGQIDDIIVKTKDIFKRNYDKGHDTTALKALGEQRSTLELLCKISAYMHQTKLLELQEQQNTDKQEDEDDFAERLKILTLPELQMLRKIQQKIETQDKSMIIIAEQTETYETLKTHEQSYVKPEPERSNQVLGNQSKHKVDSRSKVDETGDDEWMPEPGENVSWINDRPVRNR